MGRPTADDWPPLYLPLGVALREAGSSPERGLSGACQHPFTFSVISLHNDET